MRVNTRTCNKYVFQLDNVTVSAASPLQRTLPKKKKNSTTDSVEFLFAVKIIELVCSDFRLHVQPDQSAVPALHLTPSFKRLFTQFYSLKGKSTNFTC